MIPASFSIKGFASIRFATNKDNMDSRKVWTMLSNIWSYYPEKVEFHVSQQRGSLEKATVHDNQMRDAMYKMISGCIETCDIRVAFGKSVNLLLGSCYEYRIPFGVRSSDTGHETMMLPLPLPMDGCYILSAQLDGAFKKDGAREHYMAEMNLDIHVGELKEETYESLLERGIRVYPFKLRHPEYFADDDSSGSEFTTDASDAESGKSERTLTERKAGKRTKSILRSANKVQKRKKEGAGSAIRSAINFVASSSKKGGTGMQEVRNLQLPKVTSIIGTTSYTGPEEDGRNDQHNTILNVRQKEPHQINPKE